MTARKHGHAWISCVRWGADACNFHKTEPVWCVWAESGEYEQFSRDLLGIFATRDLAEAHVAQVNATKQYDECEVVEDRVLTEIPTRVTEYRWSAHILPSGEEDKGLGFDRDRWKIWSNEASPTSGTVDKWSGRDTPDLHIEAHGTNSDEVRAEYRRCLNIARKRLGVAP